MKLLNIAAFGLTLFFMSCGEDVSGGNNSSASQNTSSSSETPTCTTPAGDNLFAISSPKGAEVYSAGDTLKVEFSMNVSNSTGALIELSTDGGRIFVPIVQNSILPKSETGVECFTVLWVIPQDLIAESTSTAKIKVRDYADATLKTTSESFTINP